MGWVTLVISIQSTGYCNKSNHFLHELDKHVRTLHCRTCIEINYYSDWMSFEFERPIMRELGSTKGGGLSRLAVVDPGGFQGFHRTTFVSPERTCMPLKQTL